MVQAVWAAEMGPRAARTSVLSGGVPAFLEWAIRWQSNPAHSTRPEFNAPEVSWNPVISPSSLVIYTGDAFQPGGAAPSAVYPHSPHPRCHRRPCAETERWDMGARIRELSKAPTVHSGCLRTSERLPGAALEAESGAIDRVALQQVLQIAIPRLHHTFATKLRGLIALAFLWLKLKLVCLLPVLERISHFHE